MKKKKAGIQSGILFLFGLAILIWCSVLATGWNLNGMAEEVASGTVWIGFVYLLFLLIFLLRGLKVRGGICLRLVGVYGYTVILLCGLGLIFMFTPVFFLGLIWYQLSLLLVLPLLTMGAYKIPGIIVFAVMMFTAAYLFLKWEAQPYLDRRAEARWVREEKWREEMRQQTLERRNSGKNRRKQ